MENPYELMYMSRMGDDWSVRALFCLYAGMQRSTVNATLDVHHGLEFCREELVQEAYTSIFRAVETYREDQSCQFRTFLSLVTQRQLLSRLRYYGSPSYTLVNRAQSLDANVYESLCMYEAIPCPDPLTIPDYNLAYKEAIGRIHTTIRTMNEKERVVFDAWYDGMSYAEASDKLNLSIKTYDGRLQRVRKKIKNAIYGEEKRNQN